MLERGELVGTSRSAESFFPSRPRTLDIGDEVEVLLEMPTEIEGETKDEFIDRRATIVKVEDNQFLVHSDAGPSEELVRWFESARIRRAPWAFGYSTPRHVGMPRDDHLTARQVGPILDREAYVVLEPGGHLRPDCAQDLDVLPHLRTAATQHAAARQDSAADVP